VRTTAASESAFRLRVVRTWPPSGERSRPIVLESFYGPWATLPTAKAQRTRLVGEYASLSRAYEQHGRARGYSPPPTVEVTIEGAVQAWQDISE
jgi:hypothetical protein